MHFKINDEWYDTIKGKEWTLDRGLLLGDGLFETIRVKRGVPLYVLAHWRRLESASKQLGLKLPFNYKQFEEAIHDIIRRNQLQEAGIRITITRGMGERGLIPPVSQKNCSIIQSFDLPHYRDNLRLMYPSIRRNETSPLTGVKSLSYLEAVMIKQEATQAGYDDALCLNTKGYLTETAISNFFLVKDNQILTPPLDDGVLPGVLRDEIKSYCVLNGISFKEQSLSPDSITAQTSAFVSNVLMGVKSVTSIQSVQLEKSILIERLSKHFDS